jgi:hypothetical protein
MLTRAWKFVYNTLKPFLFPAPRVTIFSNSHVKYTRNGKLVYRGTLEDAPPDIQKEVKETQSEMKRTFSEMFTRF